MSHSLLTVTKTLLVSTILLITWNAFAEGEAPSFGTEKVTENLFMLHGSKGFTGGNIAVFTGEDGIAIIDNGLNSVLDSLRTEIEKVTKQPVDYLINTHVHGDHIGNNAAFSRTGAALVSHRNLRASMVKNGIGQGEEFIAAPKSALPVITFNDEMTLNLNGEALRLIHFSSAHTDGDAVIHFQNSNVIHTGDILFNGLFPYIDTSNGGSLDGVIKALTAINEIADDNTKIIPGHGPMATKSDLNKTILMLKKAKSLVAAMIDGGKSDDDILAANPLQEYADYHWGFITTERMTKQIIEAVRE